MLDCKRNLNVRLQKKQAGERRRSAEHEKPGEPVRS